MPRSPDVSSWLRRPIVAVLGALLLLVACGHEGPTKDSDLLQPGRLQAASSTNDLIPLIEADLTCLYSKAGLLPNESSSLGKFRSIVAAKESGDLAGALDAADKLVKFIELKYTQYANKNAVIDCGAPIGSIGVTALKDRAVARINAYVSLSGNVCEIPLGSPATFCTTADDQTAVVYFPPGLFSKLTFVSIEENPPGFQQLQQKGLDEFPTYVRVLTEPISDFSGEPIKPLVVVCYNEAIVPVSLKLRDRLRLGKRHTASNGAVSFKLLPTPDYDAYGSTVLSEVTNFCGTNPATASAATPFPEGTLLGRLGNRVLSLFAPEPLQATAALAFRGVGGSAEEFSEFGAIDRGLSAFGGGVGGSAEEFLRAGARVSTDGDTVVGRVGVDVNVTDPAQLPKVRVVSPTLGTPIAGVVVNFQLIDPVTTGPASNASFCGATTAVTNANGEASPACLNFGTTVGFKNLKATFDPTGVEAEACMIDLDGNCFAANALGINFLVATIAGDPAKLAVVNAPGATAARAGIAMDPQPILQVQDLGGNNVTGLSADFPATVAVTKADGTAGGSLSGFTSATDRSTGRITLSGLALGGTVGTAYKLTFGSGSLGTASANVTVTGAGAPAVLSVTPTSATAQAGGAIPTITATVRDASGNAVAGEAVSVSAADLGCVGGGTACLAATTGADGAATFTNLAVFGAGTSRTLAFASGALSASVALTLTPGPAAAISIDQPAGGNYGSGLPIATVSPNPRVKVTDAYGNAVSGAGVSWALASTTSGATLDGSAGSPQARTTAAGGLSSIAWKLGDGDNGLRASLATDASAFVQFLASSATGGVALSCAPSSRVRKIDLGGYNTAAGAYVGTLSMQPELAARFRRLTLYMSVTGQSSGTGDYPATIKVYRGSKTAANLLATGTPTHPNGIQLPGDNGSFAPVEFTLVPNPASTVAIPGNSNFVLIEVAVTAPSTRTIQLWYNQPSGGGTCGSTNLYAPSVTNFQGAASRDMTSGILIRVTN